MLFSNISMNLLAQQKVIRYEGGKRKTANEKTLPKDSLGRTIDSLAVKLDSLTVKLDSLDLKLQKGDSLNQNIKIDTSFLAPTTKLTANKDTTKAEKVHKKRFSFTKDTLPAGRLTLLSLIPGVGQVYNRQYWKVPVFYGLIGGFAAGGLITSKSYQKSKAEWQRTVDLKLPQAQQDYAQGKMERDGMTRTLFYAMAGATYLYQVADATFNYRGPVDHIRKATTLAAIFPGAGFIYTRTYWRLPIYYGGFLALATVVDYNSRSYQRYQRAYNAMTDNDPTTVDEFNGQYTSQMLQNARNQYRRNRDFGIICIIGAYILSIVDTHVIATLKNWDISPDLSVTIEPTLIDNSIQRASSLPTGGGLSLKIKF